MFIKEYDFPSPSFTYFPSPSFTSNIHSLKTVKFVNRSHELMARFIECLMPILIETRKSLTLKLFLDLFVIIRLFPSQIHRVLDLERTNCFFFNV